MTYTFKFYKTENNKWYIDIPEWIGVIDELEMVCGADLLLDVLSNNTDSVYVNFALEPFPNCHTLQHNKDGYYQNSAWHGPSEIWLCEVTLYVFGVDAYPEYIYYD